MNEPGATTSIIEPQLEKSERASLFVDDATVTAVEMQPGELTELSKPSLPAAITVAMPTVLKVSIASLSGSVSAMGEELAAAQAHVDGIDVVGVPEIVDAIEAQHLIRRERQDAALGHRLGADLVAGRDREPREDVDRDDPGVARHAVQRFAGERTGVEPCGCSGDNACRARNRPRAPGCSHWPNRCRAMKRPRPGNSW